MVRTADPTGSGVGTVVGGCLIVDGWELGELGGRWGLRMESRVLNMVRRADPTGLSRHAGLDLSGWLGSGEDRAGCPRPRVVLPVGRHRAPGRESDRQPG